MLDVQRKVFSGVSIFVVISTITGYYNFIFLIWVTVADICVKLFWTVGF